MSEFTKNHVAWRAIFAKYNIPQQIQEFGYFEITAKQINEFREARLMTKFDTKTNLPDSFKEYHLSVLPISRGSYVIAPFEAYKNFESLTSEIIHVDFPPFIESIDHKNITSESTAINCVFISGILDDFMGDSNILPTVSGRMSSNVFDFVIHNSLNESDFSVSVTNSQIEIDGGFEGTQGLALLEAKNILSDDFLVRQLYYPYRCWSAIITKPVRPIFMTYSNSIFSLYEYAFTDPNHYNSLTLIRHKNYSFESTEITLDDITEVMNRTRFVTEPQIPFPQADKFRRIINLCELLDGQRMTLGDFTAQYAFDARQSRYYSDAARYLGFVERARGHGEIYYSLTHEAKRILRLKFKERQLMFIEKILSHRVFYETLRLTLQDGEIPDVHTVVGIMQGSNLYQVNKQSTYKRRTGTITGWINWMLDLTK